MPLGSDYDGQDCTLARALEVVGERWTLLVLRDCLFGVRRFSDLVAHLDISRAVLAARLADLVDAGLLERHEYRPGRHEYRVTAAGADLWPALHALTGWGERHFSPGGRRRVFVHAACDAEIDASGVCSRCAARPGPAELEIRPGPALVDRRDDPVSVALRKPHRLLTQLPG
jgi:DNA-binding HxlR family transcriptional regulator